MKRWHGDGTAIGAIVFGAAVALTGTSVVAPWLTEKAFEKVRARIHAEESVRAREAVPSERGLAFRASSFNSGFSVQGDYAGQLTLEGETLRLRVPEAHLRNFAMDGGDGAFVASVRLAIAEDTADGWRIVQRGEAYLVQEHLQVGEHAWLSDVVLEMDGVLEGESGGRWLVVEHQLATQDGQGFGQTFTYAHAPRELFALLFGWDQYGC